MSQLPETGCVTTKHSSIRAKRRRAERKKKRSCGEPRERFFERAVSRTNWNCAVSPGLFAQGFVDLSNALRTELHIIAEDQLATPNPHRELRGAQHVVIRDISHPSGRDDGKPRAVRAVVECVQLLPQGVACPVVDASAGTGFSAHRAARVSECEGDPRARMIQKLTILLQIKAGMVLKYASGTAIIKFKNASNKQVDLWQNPFATTNM